MNNKMMKYFVFLVFGMSFVVYGIMDLAFSKYHTPPMTDEEIISKAKELGMIEIKEAWILEMTGEK